MKKLREEIRKIVHDAKYWSTTDKQVKDATDQILALIDSEKESCPLCDQIHPMHVGQPKSE